MAHRIFNSLAVIIAMTGTGYPQDHPISIVPQPAEISVNEGEFVLDHNVTLAAETEGGRQVAAYFLDRISKATGFDLPITGQETAGRTVGFIIDTNITHPEGYGLSIKQSGVRLTAGTPHGLFNGVQTLLQVLPPEVLSSELADRSAWAVPCVEIWDEPRFGYRGIMLDVSRYFFTKQEVKQLIDLLALHRMNTFHWHLTDDHGWRIEIKKYPRLTEIGSMRSETLIGHDVHHRPHRFDGIPHSGFYTRQDVKEIVAYAQERFITIIPEIEMPGHSSAVLAAYPELACNEGPFMVSTVWGVHQNLYCPTERTFRFLEDVLSEVMELFPGKYIHVGGDEAVKPQWENSDFCQELIRSKGLKDERGLQSYFIRRMDEFLTAKGRRLIGWDEILEGGLSPNATVMSWRGVKGGIAAAQQGHDVVMSPTSHCYFDYYHTKDRENEPLAIGGFLPLSRVYGFEPVPESLSADQAGHILGAQGNIWTEYIPTFSHAQYMSVTRMAALCEVLWSPAENRDWDDFKERLGVQFERYDALDVTYSKHLTE